ncbi:hypothetical protein ACOMHN_016847 [Nucella lapillus]
MAEQKQKKVEVASSSDVNEKKCTFVLHEEDHTLGNSLRYMIMKNPDVEDCGYSIPHPSQSKIHLTIEIRQSSKVGVMDVLKKALKDLSGVCSHMIKTFQTEVAEYKSTHPT